MKITDLIIDPKSLGSKLWLVEVSPAYEYQNNRRTDTVLGYYNIGINKLRQITDTKECEKYVLWVGNRRLIKRKPFEAYLQSEYSI